jgi:hypothetical protein
MDNAAFAYLRFQLTKSAVGMPQRNLQPLADKYTERFKEMLDESMCQPILTPFMEHLAVWDFCALGRWPDYLRGHPLTEKVTPFQFVAGLPEKYAAIDPPSRWTILMTQHPHQFTFKSCLVFAAAAGLSPRAVRLTMGLSEEAYISTLRAGVEDLWKDPRVRLWAFNCFADVVPQNRALFLEAPERVAEWAKTPFAFTQKEFEDDFNVSLMTDSFLAAQPRRPTAIQINPVYWLWRPLGGSNVGQQ